MDDDGKEKRIADEMNNDEKEKKNFTKRCVYLFINDNYSFNSQPAVVEITITTC